MTDDRRFSPDEMKARGYDSTAIGEARKAAEAKAKAVALSRRIETAFAGIPRPRITLSVARGFDDEWRLSEERARELSRRDPESNWSEVTDDVIEAHQEYFTFADAEGCRFYLPAYLRHYLKDFPHAEYDAVYWACTESKTLEHLDDAQLSCVSDFMRLCHEYEVS